MGNKIMEDIMTFLEAKLELCDAFTTTLLENRPFSYTEPGRLIPIPLKVVHTDIGEIQETNAVKG